MKITPWLAVAFGFLGFPVLCLLLTNLLGEWFAIPSGPSVHVYNRFLIGGIFLSGPVLGCLSAFILEKLRTHQKNYARLMAVRAAIGDCILLAVLWQIGGGSWIDGMTGIALLFPLCWCVALLIFAAVARDRIWHVAENYPPIAEPR